MILKRHYMVRWMEGKELRTVQYKYLPIARRKFSKLRITPGVESATLWEVTLMEEA